MNINFEKASFKDFENIPGLNLEERAREMNRYLDYLEEKERLFYRLETLSANGPEVTLRVKGRPDRSYVNLISNDYLGFTRHPKVLQAAIDGLLQYGTGAAASPAIGGHFHYHQLIEEQIAAFFGRAHALLYTTGYTANSATLQCLFRGEDLAILDMGVHASISEGCQLATVKRFRHNDLDDLERILKMTKSKYRNTVVAIDGVYSQDGDRAPLRLIVELVKHYGAYLLMDDAHGTGVVGANGRGVLETEGMDLPVDIISGTFSKSFGHLGGYVIASDDLVRHLKYQSRQHLFSVTATPASACILESIALMDKEPHWRSKLADNVAYVKHGLLSLGLDIGTSDSAIIPVRIGDPAKAGEAGKLLLDAGIYANAIIFPAVSKKDARIRMAFMATHSFEQLDRVLEAWAEIRKKLNLTKNEKRQE